MFFKLWLLFVITRFAASQAEDHIFTYNGFRGSNLSLDGIAQITPNGLLMLTNITAQQQQSHAFYSEPLHFLNSSTGNALSFSTTFVFSIISDFNDKGGQGMAFVIAPTKGLPGSWAAEFLGLFNNSNLGNSSNHIIAVELDTIYNREFNDINNNHVGININDLKSNKSAPASYFTDQHGGYVNLSLNSGQPMQVWVEYNGSDKQLNVTLAPVDIPKPAIPLLSLSLDLSPIILEPMFVGFSSSTGTNPSAHQVLGWSFTMNGKSKELTLSQLPKLPRRGPRKKSRVLTVELPVIAVAIVVTTIFVNLFVMRRRRKFQEVHEEWELDYGPHRFKYKDLYIATKGFSDKELLGMGGFGGVYKGILPTSKLEVAVKKISHESRQGMREFVAEIVSMGQMRHRNIVPLLGYCRRKGELLLVYDFMPNGSLEKFLFDQSETTLNWHQRFRIIKGVASGLFYLHEEWEKVVVHRDIKSSNVLLDAEMNGRLGDFGLARLYNHGTDPLTTNVAGTLGYLAPEFTRTGKATPSSDVFSFGAFMLEVACGRRPIEPRESADDQILVDWVFSRWKRGAVFESADPNLGSSYVEEEMELVLRLGLICSHSTPTARPSMRQVMQYLEGHATVPELSSIVQSSGGLTSVTSIVQSSGGLTSVNDEAFDDVAMQYSSSIEKTVTPSPSASGTRLYTSLILYNFVR